MVDDILLLEHLSEEIRRIRPKIGSVDLPHLNTSGSYEELDTAHNRDLVYGLYSADKILYDKIAALKTSTDDVMHAL